jgi:outer membrane immunogenic protein
MKRFIHAACAGLIAAAVAAPSFAADLPWPDYYKAPPDEYIAPFGWTGLYVGLNGGYGFGISRWTNVTGTSGDFDISGGLIGGTLGYNLQTGLWLWGLEADLGASWIKGNGCGGGFCETRNNWLGTARGRIGYASGSWLPYVTGGVAFGDIEMTPFAAASETETKVGWTVGAGLEYAFVGALTLKAEYLYVDLGKANCTAATCGLVNDVKFNTSIVRAGVNYRF